MNNRYPMTVNGEKVLQEELHRLKTVSRPEIIKAIAEARAHGDLKENAEYHAAREQQSYIEGRIQEIEGKLSHAQVVDISALPNNGKVIFGSTVDVLMLQTDTEMRYNIVGEDEADVKYNKISYSSPIGRALIGKEVGDTVSVQTPGGLVEYEILDVRYKE